MVSKQSDIRRADKRQTNQLVPRDFRREVERRPLRDLQCGRHVHQEEQQHWRDHEHLLKGIQEGTKGEKMPFFLLFSCIGWRGAVVGPRLTSWP